MKEDEMGVLCCVADMKKWESYGAYTKSAVEQIGKRQKCKWWDLKTNGEWESGLDAAALCQVPGTDFSKIVKNI